jgi:hypothetical protein
MLVSTLYFTCYFFAISVALSEAQRDAAHFYTSVAVVLNIVHPDPIF